MAIVDSARGTRRTSHAAFRVLPVSGCCLLGLALLTLVPVFVGLTVTDRVAHSGRTASCRVASQLLVTGLHSVLGSIAVKSYPIYRILYP